MDQMLTWREMGFNMTHREPDGYDRYDSLPEWALASLKKHTRDKRPQIYELEQLERAETGDEIWNAAQRELVRTGKMHNYLACYGASCFAVDRNATGCAGVHAGAEQQVRARWSRSQFI